MALTKSDLQSFLQCPRKVWLEHHSPELADPNESTSIRRAKDGQIVGEKAREALGQAIVWPPRLDTLEDTARHALEQLKSEPGRPAASLGFAESDIKITISS